MLVVRHNHRLTFVVLTLAVSSFALLQSLVIPVLSLLERELDTDQTTVTWVLTAYLLSAAVSTPLLGRLGDVVGKKRMLVVALLALSIGSLMAAASPTIEWLILARVVQGVGGGVIPLSFGIIRDEFPGEKTNSGLSIVASFAAVGFGVGIVVAGPVVDVLGYRWLFWLPMIMTALAALGAAALVPESPVRTRGPLPLVPAVLLSGWLLALLLGLSRGNGWGWGSGRVLGLFAGAFVLAALWILVETRVTIPLIDMHLMRKRGIWTSNVIAAFAGFGTFASFGFLPQFLQTPSEVGYGFGATVTEAGHILLPSAVATFVVGSMTARLIRVHGTRVVVASGTLASAAAFGSIALWHDSTWQLLAATSVQGIGSGLVFSSLAGVVIASAPQEQTGVASGTNANIRTVGGAIGSAVMAGVVTGQLGPHSQPLEAGYVLGFTVLAIGMLLATGITTLLPNVHEQPGNDSFEGAQTSSLALLPGGPAVIDESGRRSRPAADYCLPSEGR